MRRSSDPPIDTHTPAGEVARASYERWGVPLRSADAAELEYREWLYDLNSERIDQWVEAGNPGNYAGYYLDHAAGGVMRIGFLNNQAEQLANLESSLPAGGKREVRCLSRPSVRPVCDCPVDHPRSSPRSMEIPLWLA